MDEKNDKRRGLEHCLLVEYVMYFLDKELQEKQNFWQDLSGHLELSGYLTGEVFCLTGYRGLVIGIMEHSPLSY